LTLYILILEKLSLMKLNANVVLFFLFAILSFTFSCSKKKLSPKEQLPPLTHTGAGTFGCLINGQFFKPKWNGLWRATLECHFVSHPSLPYSSLNINAENQHSYFNVLFRLQNPSIDSGSSFLYSINNDTGKVFAACGKAQWGRWEFQTDENSMGEFKITYLDIVKRIISGTFWFDAYDSTGTVIHVTDGRFDISYDS